MKTKASSENTRSQGATREDLLVAAEKVFATNGIRVATLRQIREEAGQKNESAIHYHFGSREAIIQAILEKRTKPIDQQRMHLIRQAWAKSASKRLSTAEIVSCLFKPLAQQLIESDEPSYYMRFLLQLRIDRHAARQFSFGPFDRGVRACLEALVISKPFMPRTLMEQRFVSAGYLNLGVLAAIEHAHAEKGQAYRHHEAVMRVEELYTHTTAIFDAPISPQVLAALEEDQASGEGGHESTRKQLEASRNAMGEMSRQLADPGAGEP